MAESEQAMQPDAQEVPGAGRAAKEAPKQKGQNPDTHAGMCLTAVAVAMCSQNCMKHLYMHIAIQDHQDPSCIDCMLG